MHDDENKIVAYEQSDGPTIIKETCSKQAELLNEEPQERQLKPNTDNEVQFIQSELISDKNIQSIPNKEHQSIEECSSVKMKELRQYE